MKKMLFSVMALLLPLSGHARDISPELIKAIIKVESNGNPRAVSKKGAIGLMQIMPLWVPELKAKGIIRHKRDLFNPEKNIQAGKYILNKYRGKRMLLRYSGGSKAYAKRVKL